MLFDTVGLSQACVARDVVERYSADPGRFRHPMWAAWLSEAEELRSSRVLCRPARVLFDPSQSGSCILGCFAGSSSMFPGTGGERRAVPESFYPLLMGPSVDRARSFPVYRWMRLQASGRRRQPFPRASFHPCDSRWSGARRAFRRPLSRLFRLVSSSLPPAIDV